MEKIAQEYKQLGMQLALQEAGLVKEAVVGSLAAKLLRTRPGTAATTTLGLGALGHAKPELLQKLLKPGRRVGEEVSKLDLEEYLKMFA